MNRLRNNRSKDQLTRDFTLRAYHDLITALRQAGYAGISVLEYLQGDYPEDRKIVILRHDVDALPFNSLAKAEVEKAIDFRSSYYFRAVSGSYEPEVMRKIEKMGHEVGYHYEDLASQRGDVEKAWESFQSNLDKFRQVVQIKTACMHGSPLSRYDNRDLWKSYDYSDVGIVGEPYFSLDFGKIKYLTDTGRRWDGGRVSIRDRTEQGAMQIYRTSFEIIEALNGGMFPTQALITTHPQRWNDGILPWSVELVTQNIKNAIKRIFLIKKKLTL